MRLDDQKLDSYIYEADEVYSIIDQYWAKLWEKVSGIRSGFFKSLAGPAILSGPSQQICETASATLKSLLDSDFDFKDKYDVEYVFFDSPLAYHAFLIITSKFSARRFLIDPPHKQFVQDCLRSNVPDIFVSELTTPRNLEETLKSRGICNMLHYIWLNTCFNECSDISRLCEGVSNACVRNHFELVPDFE